jgi:mannose-1-phosphate guanylyltransferase
VQAVILVGGEGRRLRPLTDTRPKPMMTLVDRPFVVHQLDHLRRHGVTDVVLSCGYRPEALQAELGDGSPVGVHLSYVVDPEPLGTGGAIKNAEPLVSAEELLVLNGDILTDLDLGALAARHRRTGALGTLFLTPVEDPSRYGLVPLRADGSVEAFLEKPGTADLEAGEPSLINAGTYLLGRGFLDLIPAGRACSVEREVFPAAAARGVLFGFPSDAYWRDIGTPDSYLAAHADVMLGRVRTDVVPADPHLGPGAVVEEGVALGPVVCLGAGASLRAGSRVERAVVGDGADVGPEARVTDAILGAGVRVCEGAVVGSGAVIGDGARIGAGAELRGARVATGAQVAPGSIVR